MGRSVSISVESHSVISAEFSSLAYVMDYKSMPTLSRDLVFVSHANPEDNDFSLWLTLRLAREGYPVWCDLTRLLGGEDFWADIEDVLRNRAVKFLFVLSRNSNRKTGTLQELYVAQSVARKYDLKDFIIPLRLDDIPYGDINIQLSRLNAINFHEGWDSGLRRILEKLELDSVQKDDRFSPDSVASWWCMRGTPRMMLDDSPEEHFSNWFPIRRLPDSICLHSSRILGKVTLGPKSAQYPTYRFGSFLISFAPADDLFTLESVTDTRAISSESIPLREFLRGQSQSINIRRTEARNVVTALLRQAWEQHVTEAGMKLHHLSDRSAAAYLANGRLENNFVSVPEEFGGSHRRALVGYRSRRDTQGRTRYRYWHFAIEARPTLYPSSRFMIVPHLLVSNDGESILESGKAMNRIRRGFAKDWWNSEWRDRTLGVMRWLASSQQNLKIQLGSGTAIDVDTRPELFISPVSYIDPDTHPASYTLDRANLADSTESAC